MNDWIDEVGEKREEDKLADMVQHPHQCERCGDWLLEDEPWQRIRIVVPSAGLMMFVCDDCFSAIVSGWPALD